MTSAPPAGSGDHVLTRLLPYLVVPSIFAALFFTQDSNKIGTAVGFVLTLGLGVFLVTSRSDVAVAQTAAADEPQQDIFTTSAMTSYVAVGLTALVGFLVEMARGDGVGPFTLICFVGGLTQLVSLLYLSRTR